MTMRFVNIIIPCDGYEISETGSREFSGNSLIGSLQIQGYCAQM